jgi:hypothetical protein
VEDVDGNGEGAQWTKVLETADGRGVRADYRCAVFEPKARYAWEQQLSGSPFERHLRDAGVEVSMRPLGAGSEVELTVTQSLRGLSRLGAPMMRRAQGETVEAALDGIEAALAPEDGDSG